MIDEKILENLKISANISRGLAIDMVANVKSGHLGLPFGCAEIGAALFGYLLRIDPENPRWCNRDRFILSAGHGSAFLYIWLYLLGFEVGELNEFRVRGSKLPGHPEFDITPGVECTTGPLGQGVGNSIGFAISQKMQQAISPENILDYKIICLCGDGCLQEGISHEACSLAGHFILDNLILIYDANEITLDADLRKSQSDDIVKRFESYGFFVQEVDGHNILQFIEVYERAKISKKPSLIIAKTVIGKGMKKIQGTNKAHGESGLEFINEVKKDLGLPDVNFFIDDDIKKFFADRRNFLIENANLEQKKIKTTNEYNSKKDNIFSEKFLNKLCDIFSGKAAISTRVAGGKILNEIAKIDEKNITGSADLFSSARNYLEGGGDFNCENYSARNIYFGVREHAMGAILNGIAYDGIFTVSGSTFLVFSDYLRPSIRVAALANLPIVYIFTHDSIAVGQDGPTHQPVETLSSLRCIPNLDVIRPADAIECVGAYCSAFSRKNGPTALILSRQDLAILSTENINNISIEGTLRGAYIAQKEEKFLQLIIVATGSEVALALSAAKNFKEYVRVVSMPSMEIFERQNKDYMEFIFPSSCKNRMAIEAGIAMPWFKYILNGKIISVDDFGFSAAGNEIQEFFGFSVQNIIKEITQNIDEITVN